MIVKVFVQIVRSFNSNLNTAWFDHIVIVAQAQLPPLVTTKCEEPAAEMKQHIKVILLPLSVVFMYQN